MGPLRARNTNLTPAPLNKAAAGNTSSSQDALRMTELSQPQQPRLASRSVSRNPAPPACSSTSGAEADPWAHPEVRELLLENEQMLVELAAFQELGTAYAKKRTEAFMQTEASQRRTIEAAYWEACCALLSQAAAQRFAVVDKALQEAVAANEELQGCVALAQDALGAEEDDDVARRLSTSSPGSKRRRVDGGTDDTPSSVDDGSGKKRARTSAQKSPAHLTHMRKTLQPEKLPATLSMRRADSIKGASFSDAH